MSDCAIPNGQSVQCELPSSLQLESGKERVHTTKLGEKLRLESQIEPEVTTSSFTVTQERWSPK